MTRAPTGLDRRSRLDAEQIDRNLRRWAMLTHASFHREEERKWMADEIRRRRRHAWVDMSAAAIDQRLREVSQLHHLCLAIAPDRSASSRHS